jgi:hypothetical protein
MLLIPEHRALFLHLPKTGGQTIENLLGFRHHHDHHSTKNLPEDWQKWFRFTFVRHPTDRFISACNYYVGMAKRHHHRYRDVDNPSPLIRLRLWLLDETPSLPQVVERLKVSRDYKRISCFVPQMKRLKVVQPHFIGRFERFQQDVDTVLRLLDSSQRLQPTLPHLNRSQQHYRIEQLDRQSHKRLARMYRVDYRQLGYRPTVVR